MRINNNLHNNIAFQGKFIDRGLRLLGSGKSRLLDYDFLNFKEKNLAFPSYAALLMGVVIGSRYFQARDNDEKREILTRDLTGLSIYLFAIPVLKRLISRITEKTTGFLTVFKKNIDKLDEVNTREGGFFSKIKGYLFRDSGYQLLSFDDITNTYVKNNKLSDFCDLIIANTSKEGKNLYKIFSFAFTKIKGENSLEEQLKKFGSSNSNENIKNWIQSIENNSAKSGLLEKIRKEFEEKGAIHQKALGLKAIPDLMALGITVFLLGFFLPWLNIKYTRMLYLNKAKNQDQPVNNNINNGFTLEQNKVYENSIK